jgi:hypothetical protein
MFWSPLNAYAQVRAGRNGMLWQPAGGVFAVEGTVYPGAPLPPTPITDNDDEGWWAGFASGAIGGLVNVADGQWYVECVGYPAITTPMLPSATIGGHNLGVAVRSFADAFKVAFGFYPPICVVSWSQGTMAVNIWWTTEVLPENGTSHYLMPYIYRSYEYGQPWRAEGISIGDDRAGLPGPGKLYGKATAGVGGTKYNLTSAQTLIAAPDGVNVINGFNNKGDLYGAAPSPSTQAGQVEAGFADMIFRGTVSIKSLGSDLFKIIGDVEAGFNVLKFFGAGSNAPHYHYEQAMGWVISDLVALGNSLPHQLGV